MRMGGRSYHPRSARRTSRLKVIRSLISPQERLAPSSHSVDPPFVPRSLTREAVPRKIEAIGCNVGWDLVFFLVSGRCQEGTAFSLRPAVSNKGAAPPGGDATRGRDVWEADRCAQGSAKTAMHDFRDQTAQARAATQQEARRLLGERLRASRLAAQLTQEDLAGSTYSKSYISAVERGKMIPSISALGILASRLGVSRSFLLGEEAGTPTLEASEEQGDAEPQGAMLSEAERCLQEGRFEESLALFEQAGQQDRTNWVQETYAHFLAEQGRYQEAYEQLRRTRGL